MMQSIKANEEGLKRSPRIKTIQDRNPGPNLVYVTVSIVAIIMPRDSALHMARNARHVVIKTTLPKSVNQEVNQLVVPILVLLVRSHLNTDK